MKRVFKLLSTGPSEVHRRVRVVSVQVSLKSATSILTETENVSNLHRIDFDMNHIGTLVGEIIFHFQGFFKYLVFICFACKFKMRVKKEDDGFTK